MFDTVLIAGLGLMGGSMAKTIKARTLSRVLGWNRTRATAEQARADGTIDAVATEALYKEADLVIIGLYPQATVDWLLENMPKMKKAVRISMRAASCYNPRICFFFASNSSCVITPLSSNSLYRFSPAVPAEAD